ncbi:MAG: signal recognition particle subunit SRP19/SEC65 family protein [Infirmifilum sp.]
MKRKNGRIIWTVYFDSSVPRNKGRRVPLNLAINKPTIEEVLLAAQKAGYSEVLVEKEKKFPALWYEDEGRLIVNSGEKKSVMINKIAAELLKLRAGSKKK